MNNTILFKITYNKNHLWGTPEEELSAFYRRGFTGSWNLVQGGGASVALEEAVLDGTIVNAGLVYDGKIRYIGKIQNIARVVRSIENRVGRYMFEVKANSIQYVNKEVSSELFAPGSVVATILFELNV